MKSKQNGVKKFVVLGSYFTYFADSFPELGLERDHVYIRTREEQKAAVLEETSPGFDTFVLELPYILGTLKGRVPPWTFIFLMLAGIGKRALFFKRGGTAAVTAGQVGQAAIGALEKGIGGNAYPLGGKNYEWGDFAEKYFEVTRKRKKLIALHPWVFRTFGVISALFLRIRGKERGLDIGRFGALQYMDAFIDPDYSMRALGYAHDDYDAELSKVIEEWVSIRKKGRNRTDIR